MNNFFGRPEPIEHEYTYDETLNAVQEAAVNEKVEVPNDPIQPEVTEDTPQKPAIKGKSAGGSDYVFRGDF